VHGFEAGRLLRKFPWELDAVLHRFSKKEKGKKRRKKREKERKREVAYTKPQINP